MPDILKYVTFFYFPSVGVREVACRSWLLGVFLVLSGCAGPEVRHEEITTVTIQPARGQTDAVSESFVLSGRLAVNTKQYQFSGGIRWQHSGHGDEIYLFSPLGQVVAKIFKDQTGVRLITSEPATYQAQTVEYLTSQVLGWELPLVGMQFWVRGTHFPGTVAEKDLDRNKRTIAIRQDGWRIIYQNYYPAEGDMPALPRLVEFSRVDIKMKLVVDQWQDEAKKDAATD